MSDPGVGVSRSYRLVVPAPWHGAGLFDFFAQRAVPGVESATEYPGGRLYRRAVRLAHGHGLVSVSWPPAIGLEPVAGRQTGPSSPAGPPFVLAPVAVGVDTIVADGRDHDEALALARRGVRTREDLADQAVDDLADIEGLSAEQAGVLIMKARAPMFEAQHNG